MSARGWGIAVSLAWLGAASVVGQSPMPQPEAVTPATAAPTLPPCETAEADVLLLKARVAQLEQQLVTTTLEAERVRLEAKFRAQLSPPAEYVFDWQTKTFKAPTPGPKPGGS